MFKLLCHYFLKYNHVRRARQQQAIPLGLIATIMYYYYLQKKTVTTNVIVFNCISEVYVNKNKGSAINSIYFYFLNKISSFSYDYSLTKIRLRNTVNWLRFLPNLKYLAVCDFIYNPKARYVRGSLSELTALTHLVLDVPKVPDSVQHLKHLQVLRLIKANVFHCAVKFDYLHTLVLNNVLLGELMPNCKESDFPFPNLEKLIVSTTAFPDRYNFILPHSLKSLPKLKTFIGSYMLAIPDNLKHYTALETLVLDHVTIINGVKELKSVKKLYCLSSDNEINEMSKLENLVLINSRVFTQTFDKLMNVKTLHMKIKFAVYHTFPRIGEVLSQLRNLELLFVQHGDVYPYWVSYDLEAIGDLERLERITLINVVSCIPMSFNRLKNLKSLGIECTNLKRKQVMEVVKTCKTLKQIHYSKYCINENAVYVSNDDHDCSLHFVNNLNETLSLLNYLF